MNMKKSLKFTAIALIVFALVTNLHSTLFSFYGLKTNNLDGSVFAATLDTTTGDGTGAGTNTNPGEAWWDSPIYSTVHCGVMFFTGNEYNHGTGTVSYTTEANGLVTATVSFDNGSSTSYTGSRAAHDSQMSQCIGPNWAICSGITALDACQ